MIFIYFLRTRNRCVRVRNVFAVPNFFVAAVNLQNYYVYFYLDSFYHPFSAIMYNCY